MAGNEKDGGVDETNTNTNGNKDGGVDETNTNGGNNATNKDGGNEKAKEEVVNLSKEEYEKLTKTVRESQKLIKDFDKKKKEKEELELLEKWKFEELLNKTKTELETYKTKAEDLESKYWQAEARLKSIAQGKISEFKKEYWEEKLQAVIDIVWDDEIILAEKLDKFKSFVWQTTSKKIVDWWTPSWNGVDRLKQLREKASKEKLSYQEQLEYAKLVTQK